MSKCFKSTKFKYLSKHSKCIDITSNKVDKYSNYNCKSMNFQNHDHKQFTSRKKRLISPLETRVLRQMFLFLKRKKTFHGSPIEKDLEEVSRFLETYLFMPLHLFVDIPIKINGYNFLSNSLT